MEQAVTIATFYHFTDFADYQQWQQPLLQKMQQSGMVGLILLADEGLNATIAGSQKAVEAVISHIKADVRFSELFVKYSRYHKLPFDKPKVRLKKETITLGQPHETACLTGEHLSPEAWNELLDNPEVLVLDTRNSYETHLGSFKNATIWPLEDFQEIAEKIRDSVPKNQKVAMFCTGGIRCEKLSSWMLGEGYENIYQLEGGIIHYLNEIPEAQSKWQGDCYVFDERVAVTHGTQPSQRSTLCPACGHALSAEDRQHPHYLPAIHCPHC